MARIFRWLSASIVVAMVGGTIASAWLASNGHAQAPKASPERDADRKAIAAASKAFAKSFADGDAKTAAAHWTENGEYSDDRGIELRGREAIEKQFAASFKARPKATAEVLIESIRFPSKDTAIEEGILRTGTDGAELPKSTFYRAWHVRENGEWKIASAREWGANVDRLEDLAWLVGAWKGVARDKEMLLTFKWDQSRPFMTGEFVTKVKDKTVATGHFKIGFDAAKGLLKSWHFDEDGGHGQAFWIRDGNRWVMDSRGALANGDTTAAVNILTRLSPTEITWRSIDRVVGGAPAPDTLPVKLVKAAH